MNRCTKECIWMILAFRMLAHYYFENRTNFGALFCPSKYFRLVTRLHKTLCRTNSWSSRRRFCVTSMDNEKLIFQRNSILSCYLQNSQFYTFSLAKYSFIHSSVQPSMFYLKPRQTVSTFTYFLHYGMNYQSL